MEPMGDPALTCMWDGCGQVFLHDRGLKEHIIDDHIGGVKKGNLLPVLKCHCMCMFVS